MRTIVHVGFVVLAVSGCAGLRARPVPRTPDELRAALAPRLPELPAEEIVIPHEIADEHVLAARRFLSRKVGPKGGTEERIRALLRMVTTPAGLGLRYEWATTADADDTIEHGGGSCLSLSAVLIALARGLGIKAYYVDASRIASETTKEGAFTVHSGHIAVMLEYQQTEALIDFAGEIDETYRTRRVEDTEIVAHYYNNRGYEIIRAAQRNDAPVPWREVLRHFRISTKISPDFAMAWNNAGLALQRLGREHEAVLALEYALTLDAHLEAARRNLEAWRGGATAPGDVSRRVSIRGGGVEWKMAAGRAAAITWRVTPRLELGLEPEVPEAAVEAER